MDLTHPASFAHDLSRFLIAFRLVLSSENRVRNRPETPMSNSILKVTPATLDLEEGEIPAKWLLSGDPKTRNQ
jgi:hypothetical protein